MSFLQRTWNVGNGLVAAGLVILCLTFVWPWVTSHRVARVESWAEEIAADLLEAAIAARPIDFEDPAAAAALLEKLPDRTHAARLETTTAPAELPPGLYFEGKHYYYLVTEAAESDTVTPDGTLEVYAWPRGQLSPSRTAFFSAQGSPPTYSRNLRRHYLGWERVPRPGTGRPRHLDPRATSYLGNDDERWIHLPGRRLAGAQKNS